MFNDETSREAAPTPVASRKPTATVGIVGAGFMGRVHAAAARSAGARVIGVVASSDTGVPAAVEAVGAENGYSSTAELLAVPELDVVHVCVPNYAHYEVSLAAIEAGKNVVCEKPLAVSVEQAQKLADAARAAGVSTAVPFIYRFHPMVREMRNRVMAGEGGEIGLLQGSYLQDWMAGADSNWRVDTATGGLSRTFADIGSHWFDLLEFVTARKVASVSAQFSTLRPFRSDGDGVQLPVKTEDSVTVQFRMDNGVIGSFSAAQTASGRKNRLFLEVSGTRESYAFDQENPELLWVGDSLGSRNIVRDPSTLSVGAREYAVLPSGHAQGYQDCFNAFARDVYRAIAGDRPVGLPDFTAGLRSAQIIDAVITSQSDGSRWVDVPAATTPEGASE